MTRLPERLVLMPPNTVKDSYLTDSVMTASPSELIVMLYERLELDLARAARALRIVPVELEAAHHALVHAQEVVMGLRASLRTEVWTGGEDLLAIYEWLSARLLAANLSKDPADVEECAQLVAPLAAAWRGAGGGAGADEADHELAPEVAVEVG